MKRVEIGYTAIMTEIAKLNTRLEKTQARLEKKRAAAEKLGVADMTADEHSAWLATVPTENGWIVNKADIKKNGAWFDLFGAEREVNEITAKIENAQKRMEKAETELTAYREELAQIEDLKKREELWKLDFEAEQREWAKDGITLTSRYMGTTPKGRRFEIDINHGYTMRSLHCFTLSMTDESGEWYTVFTSGEFWRAYAVIKAN